MRSRGEALKITERHGTEGSVNANGTERVVGTRIRKPLPDSSTAFVDTTGDESVSRLTMIATAVHNDSHRFPAEAHALTIKAS